MLNRTINKITSEIPYMNDEIFITFTSFEERTLAVTAKLSKTFNPKAAFIFKFSEENTTNLRELNFEKQYQILSELTHVYPIICDHHDPTDGIKTFKKVCSELNISLENKKISIDITTFTKQYLFLMLTYLYKQKISELRIFYTEPAEYAVGNQPLSHGYIGTVSIPTFGGHFSVWKENLLILSLGFEGDRAFGIWERFSPHKTILLIGQDKNNNEWNNRVKELNTKLINKVTPDSIKFISSNNPFDFERSLIKILSKNIDAYNIAISTLGPNLQVLGIYLSQIKFPDVQVLYSIPKYHDEYFYSKSISTIWEFN